MGHGANPFAQASGDNLGGPCRERARLHLRPAKRATRGLSGAAHGCSIRPSHATTLEPRRRNTVRPSTANRSPLPGGTRPVRASQTGALSRLEAGSRRRLRCRCPSGLGGDGCRTSKTSLPSRSLEPNREHFGSMRRRSGSLADVACVVGKNETPLSGRCQNLADWRHRFSASGSWPHRSWSSRHPR